MVSSTRNLWDCHLLTRQPTNNLRSCFPHAIQASRSFAGCQAAMPSSLLFPSTFSSSDVDTHTHRWPLNCLLRRDVTGRLHIKTTPWPVLSISYGCPVSSSPFTVTVDKHVTLTHSHIYLHTGRSLMPSCSKQHSAQPLKVLESIKERLPFTWGVVWTLPVKVHELIWK